MTHIVSAASSPEAVEQALQEALLGVQDQDRCRGQRAATMLGLWHGTPHSWRIVREILQCANHGVSKASTDFWASAFDSATIICPKASAALYSFGRADLLEFATASIVERLQQWGLLRADTRMLDLGCGSGRLIQAAAPHVRCAVGIDISRAMLAAARRRCATLSNVQLLWTSGRNFRAFEEADFDFIAAVDVFAYLVSCDGLAAEHFIEARRVLKLGGVFLILNYAYAVNKDLEAAEVVELASLFDFEIVRMGRNDFAFWDVSTFHLKRGK